MRRRGRRASYGVTRRDAPEVLQSVGGALDEPSSSVKVLVEAEQLLPVIAVGNDRLGPALVQALAQLGSVVSLNRRAWISTALLCV